MVKGGAAPRSGKIETKHQARLHWHSKDRKHVTWARPCNEHPGKPHFILGKESFVRVYIIFPIFTYIGWDTLFWPSGKVFLVHTGVPGSIPVGVFIYLFIYFFAVYHQLYLAPNE